MAKVIYKGAIKNKPREEDRIHQGDYVFCDANGSGASSFWGIYSESLKTVIALDGGGSQYVKGNELYLGETYVYWTITKRILANKVILSIEEEN
ncbi:hypothetical protein [Niallia circulans]|uniref:hypothetical protein n=1 Tax=Niallia circulans TaxID=1397 RepID=UPI0026EEA863|nr:hypothetical protein [Niallia circulans]